LGNRRRGGEEGARNLLRGQPTHLAQRERRTGIRREGRVAAGENQLEPVVRQFVVGADHVSGFAAVQRARDLGLQRVESGAAAQCVDGPETPGRDQPRARIRRETLIWPAAQRGVERVLHRILGEIEIAQQSDERREDAAAFRAIDGVELGADLDQSAF
jgi:hypothetical protein